MTDIYKNASNRINDIQTPKDISVIKETEPKETVSPANAPEIKEVKFFSDPKTVKKKTQGSILAFQTGFAVLFCLLYKLAQLFIPELYYNINTYLERLFGW